MSKYFKFDELTSVAQMKAMKNYQDGWNEEHFEQLSESELRACCDEGSYTIDGEFVHNVDADIHNEFNKIKDNIVSLEFKGNVGEFHQFEHIAELDNDAFVELSKSLVTHLSLLAVSGMMYSIAYKSVVVKNFNLIRVELTVIKSDKYYLSGNHDDDYFLSQDDMSEELWDVLMSCHHQGQCDDDCSNASSYFEIKDILKAKEYVLNCGVDEDSLIDDSEDHADEELIFNYYIWLLSGDIQERGDE